MSTPRAAIYLRLAPDEDPAPHLAELREFAYALGVDVVGEFIDRGQAGDNASRPQLDAVEVLRTAGALAVVLTTELHRMARHSSHDLMYCIEAFAQAGVRFIATRDQLDTDEPRGRAMVETMRLVSAVESELARQRIKVGIEKARQRPGHRHGRPRGVSTEAVIDLHQKGLTISRIAESLKVSPTTVKSRLREWREGLGKPKS